MPSMNIGKTTSSDMTNTTDFNYQVTLLSTDGVSNQEETEWINPNWNWQWGYFNTNADLKAAITMKAIWNVGRGWTCPVPRTKEILDNITGWGKDTFDDIMFNMEIVKRVAGDAFAEIIRDEDGNLINLKVLDPSTIRIVINRQGIILRYEQISKIPGNSDKKKFKPNEILHLCHNRIADQIHGISDIDALEEVIKAEDESFADMKKLMHRQARPMIIFKLKTDDQAAISNFVSKMDKAMKDGENLYVPDDENLLSWEVVQVNPSAVVIEWRNDIRNKFYRAIGLPQVVPGAGGQSTESESKVIYLAFEQIVEKEQRYIEQQLWQQLGIKINFVPPASLLNDLNSDQGKDTMSAGQPSDLMAGAGR